MSASSEFETVEILVSSKTATLAVDAFALSLIKAEKQLRKLFTHLIFQMPCFTSSDIYLLREMLADNKKIYFEGLENGIDSLTDVSIEQLVGEDYSALRERIGEAILHRNKIFHGQLTDKFLSREELLSLVNDIKKWCFLLAKGAMENFGYDGFGRNSYQKRSDVGVVIKYKAKILNLDDYSNFIKNNVERKNTVKISRI